MNAPAECTCTVVRVDTLAETLDCPAVWMVLPTGCFHVLPARTEAYVPRQPDWGGGPWVDASGQIQGSDSEIVRRAVA